MQLIPEADYGVIGEGEITSTELIDALISNADVSQVDGLIYRKMDSSRETLCLTKPRKEVPDLDELPFPDYDCLDMFNSTEKIYTITASRSCPFHCTYCCHSGGNSYRQRSLDSIFEELNVYLTKANIKILFLTDELFATNKERVIEFCRRIKDYKIQWYLSMRISNHITSGLISMMHDSGCVEISYGLESADNRILKSMKKGITVEEIKRVLEITLKAQIKIRGNFIFGDIAETEESVQNTLSWVVKNKELFPRGLGLFMITLYPGAPLYEYAVQNGFITDTLEHIKNGCPLVNISKLSNQKYYELAKNILPQFISNLQKNDIECIITADFITMRYKIAVKCPKCNSQNTQFINPNEIDLNILFRCSECNHEVSISCIESYLDLVENKLADLFKKYKCAVWGAGGLWYSIKEFSNIIKNASLVQIDSAYKSLQESGFNVHSPDILKNGKFDAILCTAARYESIEQIAKNLYPQVKFIPFTMLGFEPTKQKPRITGVYDL